MTSVPANAYLPPNEEEIAAVNRLKARFFAEVSEPSAIFTRNDAAFLRFFRGVKRVEERAFEELVKHQAWRKENQVDDILTLREESIQRVFASGVVKLWKDKQGRPSNYGFVRVHNPRVRIVEDYRWFIIHVMERILREGDPNEQRGCMVIDLKDFGLSNMDYEMAKVMLNILQENYPETIHRIFIVDAPFIFSTCWAIVRPWVDPVTAAKIEFISHDKLSEFFPEDDIPLNGRGVTKS